MSNRTDNYEVVEEYSGEEELSNDNSVVDLTQRHNTDSMTDEEFAQYLQNIEETDPNRLDSDMDEPNAVPVPSRRRRSTATRISTVIRDCYFITTSVFIATFLGLEWGKDCDQPLFEWAFFLLGFNVLSFLLDILSCVFGFSNWGDDNNTTIGFRVCNRFMFFLQRALRMTWVFWFVMGMVWTFKSKTCRHDAPRLYYFCLTLIIIHLSIIALILLCCCCSLICLGIIYVVNPSLIIPGRNSGISSSPL
eukprot:TRINITY_DN2184_c0_g1_i2.p1 TRINITY_DN2184_c0_g1~~TRINITY_DN2184_c0_g1_i2.p1  ORF type:complete len:249 (-),score=21.91 TRINITY_DN2184_c0_g1_i2:118-864(-)